MLSLTTAGSLTPLVLSQTISKNLLMNEKIRGILGFFFSESPSRQAAQSVANSGQATFIPFANSLIHECFF